MNMAAPDENKRERLGRRLMANTRLADAVNGALTMERSMGLHGINEALDWAFQQGRARAEMAHDMRETERYASEKERELAELKPKFLMLAEQNKELFEKCQSFSDMITAHTQAGGEQQTRIKELEALLQKERADAAEQARVLTAEVENKLAASGII
jgi:erythromycin esterase-like protein